eukprot:8124142-Lingulodinium_polyedra.AAC.1
MDAQLSLRLVPLMPPYLQEEERRREMEAHKADRCIVGRQMVRLIVECFQSDSNALQCYSVVDVLNIDYPGGDKAREFWSLWEAYLRDLQDTITEETKRDILYGKIRHF